jgi:hypothetical protein
MIAASPPLRAVLAEHHVLLRLSPRNELIVDPLGVVPDEVLQRIRANQPRLIAELMSERTEWLHHWRGLVQDLADGFDAYMADDCPDALHNRWIGLFNLTEYTEVEVLRKRYGFTGCPVVDGACKPEWPMICGYCAQKIL